jgi:predicted SAM-dependent methyltransferase
MGMRETVDKIVAVQVFEHFTPVNAMFALRRWRVALKVGAPLILSVPDMDGTLELIERGDSDFALRHLRGRTGDRWNSHHAWYTRDTLIELLEYADFVSVMQLPNLHFYPAIVVKAIK